MSKRTIVKKTKSELLKQLLDDTIKNTSQQKTGFNIIDTSIIKTKPLIINTVRLPPHLTIEKLT